jgi:hypothetical protein
MMQTVQVGVGEETLLTDVELDGVALELAHLERATGWTRILGIGRIVLERFFAGDRAKWSSRKRNKSQSIRRLAERPGCPLQKTALTEAVGIYILHKDLPTIAQSDHLTPSHAAAVLGLGAPVQTELLRFAERQRLSVSDLRRHAAESRALGSGRSGRPPLPGSRKAITRLTTAVVALEEAHELVESSADLDDATRGHLLGNLRSCAQLITTLERLCADHRQSMRGTTRAVSDRSGIFAA